MKPSSMTTLMPAEELGVLFLPCDLSVVVVLRAADVEERLGAVQALINNAGNDQRHELNEITAEQWDASLSINVRQQFFTAQAVAPGMQGAGGGAIVTCPRPRS
jgi:NAD(P)-dependent dehydrogenase (short-subunit alcohol dehydrogenase family)